MTFSPYKALHLATVPLRPFLTQQGTASCHCSPQALLRSLSFEPRALKALVPCVLGATFFVDSAKVSQAYIGNIQS